jgi:hypothetical protein
MQGRNLAANQAAQSCARVLSPLCAGFLYELSVSKIGFGNGLSLTLPKGSIPFLVGAILPMLGSVVPSILYALSTGSKRSARAQE